MHRLRQLAAAMPTALIAAFVGTMPNAATADVASAAAPASARTFDVEAYDVDGARLLGVEDVEDAVYPYLGPGRTTGDIEKARAALEKAYRDRGYSTVVVNLPEQTVADNIVRLHVVEATVGRLRVTGSRYFSPEAIKREAAAFKEGQAPNINLAQAEVAELNRDPDRRVTPVLRAGVVPGTVDVDLTVNDTLPLHGSVELNNDHNQYTAPLRTYASLTYDNLFQLDHSATFTYGVAPQDRANEEIFAGSYLAPFANTPVSLLISGYRSNSNVATLGGATVLGDGYSGGFRVVVQLPHVADLIQSVSIGIDYRNFNENIFQATAPDQAAIAPTRAPVRYMPIVATYSVQHNTDKATTSATLSVTTGVLGLGSETAGFEYARANARPDFVHVNVDFTQTETLWRGFTASQHLVGQIADGPVVSSEELAGGGFTSVRGYLQSEAIGDEGLTGQLELVAPTLKSHETRVFDLLRFYGFVDGGSIWILQPLIDQQKYFALASAGAGVRMALFRHLSGDIEVAVPFISGVGTHADRPRATFSLKSDF
jgi:hemolysin activation/secretion protein